MPNRIGDAILSLPILLCLKQLQNTFGADERHIIIYPPFNLFEIIWSLKLFETNCLEEITKIKSWFNPSDELFSLDTPSRSFGLKSKKSFGEKTKAKWSTKYYLEDLPFLDFEKLENNLPNELISFLKDEFHLSLSSIRYFGVLLKLNYTTEQIKQVFSFNIKESLNFQNELMGWEPSLSKDNYIVICMEAAYNKKKESKRRWSENNYFELSEKIYKNYGLVSVFIGVEDKPKLPQNTYSLDLRGKLTLIQLAQLLKFSKAYIGNDTGPLHLANLLKIKSLCVYLSTKPEIYGPIFPELNKAIKPSDNLDEILEEEFKRV